MKYVKDNPRIAIVAALFLVATIAVLVVAILGYVYNWDWTGLNASTSPHPTQIIYQPGKTFWDWLQLLIIPVVLAVGGYIFNLAQQRREEKTTIANQEEAALQAYFDNMSELLLKIPLWESSEMKTVREKIMRAYTLSALRIIADTGRKRTLFLFLSDTNLICTDARRIELQGADLRGIDLANRALPAVDLAGTFLTGANLSRAKLSGANLEDATLVGANLEDATLVGANLEDATLIRANLSGVDLSSADLSEANLLGAQVTLEQLEKAKSLKNATMPDGSIHP